MSELPKADRRPDGVVFDPESAFPPPKISASPAEGVLSLKEPLSVDAARGVVAEFVDALTSDDFPRLASLLTTDASFRAPTRGSSARLVDIFRVRLRRFDYPALARARVYSKEDIEVYRFDDFDNAWKLPLPRPEEMAPGDMALRVPILETDSKTGRLFGDELLLVIRKEEGSPKIRAIIEEFLGW